MKGLDRLSDVYRNLRRASLFLFFIPLTSGVEAPKELKHQIAKCTCVHTSKLHASTEENSIHFLKFFGYHSVSDGAVEKSGDEDYIVFEHEKNNGPANEVNLLADTEPVSKFRLRPVVHYTIASVLTSEQAIAADGDETAVKLLRILKAASHDKNIPFKSPDAQTIQFRQPVTHSQIVQISCQLILWHKFYSLLIL